MVNRSAGAPAAPAALQSKAMPGPGTSPSTNQADSIDPVLPDNGQACVALVESLDRQSRTTDARRLYERCRERFPAQAFTPALDRAYSGR